MKLVFKILILVVLLQNQAAIAVPGKPNVVKGDSSIQIRPDETCKYEELSGFL